MKAKLENVVPFTNDFRPGKQDSYTHDTPAQSTYGDPADTPWSIFYYPGESILHAAHLTNKLGVIEVSGAGVLLHTPRSKRPQGSSLSPLLQSRARTR